MSLRGLIGVIGATALAFLATIGASSGVVQQAFAQTDAAETEEATFETRKAEAEAERAVAYESFVADLAAELGGMDPATVDAAIRSSLQQAVDDHEAAGDLSTEQAAAMRAVIDVSDAPLLGGFGGPRALRGIIGGQHSDRRGDRSAPEQDGQ